MKKFLSLLQSQTPLPKTNIERQGAMFAHLNAMVEDYQTFTTIISAEQAATMATAPIELNVPAGMYLLAGGYIYYSSAATELLDLSTEYYIHQGNFAFILYKGIVQNINPGCILLMSPYTEDISRIRSGKLTFSTNLDAEILPTGPVEITVYLTKLNLSII